MIIYTYLCAINIFMPDNDRKLIKNTMLKPKLCIKFNHTWNIKTQAFIGLYIEKQGLTAFLTPS